MLCQLSYRGLSVLAGPPRASEDFSLPAGRAANTAPTPARTPSGGAGWTPTNRRMGGALCSGMSPHWQSAMSWAVITAGRRKIATRVSPDPEMVTLTPIDAETAVLKPQAAPAAEDR